MITLERDFIVNTTVRVENIQGNAFNGETAAHQFVITAITDAQTRTETSFSGTATAYFIRSDDQTLTVSASVINGKIYATLNRDCYNLTGRFTFSIFNQNEGVTTCVYSCVGWMYRTRRDPIIDSGEVVPNIDDVTAEYQRMQTATDAATAAASAGNGAFRALAPYNAYDVLAGLTKTNATAGGITYTWGEEGSCTVRGTCTGTSGSQNLIYSNYTKLPDYVVPGGLYKVLYNGSASVMLNIVQYDAEQGTLVNTYYESDGLIRIRENAVGLRVRLYVNAGATVDTTVTACLVDGKTHQEIYDKLNPTHGVLEAETDLDVVVTNGYYLLAASRTYYHGPWTAGDEPAAPGDLCLLEVLIASDNYPAQRLTNVRTGKTYYREAVGASTLAGTIWLSGATDAELTEVGIEAARATRNILDYGTFDLAQYGKHQSISSAGIQYTWLDDNTCHVEGTAIDIMSTNHLFVSLNSLPDGVKPGMLCRVKFASTATVDNARVGLSVTFASEGAWGNASVYTGDSAFVIPEDAEGMRVRLRVLPEDTANETVSIKMIFEKTATRELGKKYAAFGDSLTVGAVWNSEVNGRSHRAPYEMRIPTRIARALGAYNSFSNNGVGGIGYITKINNQNLVDMITSYDFSETELVTVMGGANDKSKAAGTLDAVCGAIQTIITYMREHWPKVQLVFIQPTPCGVSADYDPWTTRGVGGWSLNDFDERVSKLCYENHVGYANWVGCSYCDKWAEYNHGYNGSDVVNYSHPVVDEDYILLGDYIAGKVAAYGPDSAPAQDVNVKRYTKADMYLGAFWNLGVARGKAFNPNSTVRRESNESYNCLFIPVNRGDVVRLRTMAGYQNAKPYALIGSDRTIYSIYPDRDEHSATNAFDGTVAITRNGFMAINTLADTAPWYYYQFLCEVRSDAANTLREVIQLNALPLQANRQQFLAYDDDDVCRVLKTGPSLMGAFHHWAIIGASFDSGEFNHKVNGEDREIEWYEYSCWDYLKRINGLPDLYNYSDGGQNAKEWISLGPNTVRGYAYASDTEVVNPYWSGRSGIGYGGGCWWKMKEDYERGDVKQAFVINLGSNDINNNHPHDNDWNELDDYDAARYYTCGTVADIGTYNLETDTDTVPSGKTAGVIPGVVNSYAAYIGAVLNRIFAIQPDAIVFLATIRNGFNANENKYQIWSQYNDVLRTIANELTASGGKYAGKSIYLLDNARFGPNYETAPMGSMFVRWHPNAIGYQYIAGYWNTLIDYAIQKNYIAMAQSMFIGTGKSY